MDILTLGFCGLGGWNSAGTIIFLQREIEVEKEFDVEYYIKDTEEKEKRNPDHIFYLTS